jgi:putative flippase GtrA
MHASRLSPALADGPAPSTRPEPSASRGTGMAALGRFVGVSGLGWLLDLALFTVLNFGTNLSHFVANLFSAGVAVTFVFLVSARYIFFYEGRFLLLKLLAYIGFNLVAITAASAAIEIIANIMSGLIAPYVQASYAVSGLLAKIAVTPLTLAANFLFSRFLLTSRAGR